MLKLYNTATRKADEFSSLREKQAGIYTCGPTVYNYAHIGNLRTYVFEDLLKKVLARRGYSVRHVMNITDVGHLTDDADSGEDKMEVGASREGKSVWEIADHYTEAFRKDLEKLNIQEPTIWCKATDHIQEQIELVQKLEERGYIYRLEDGMYYDTSKFSDYGKMAGLDLEGLQAGARIEQVEGKKNPTDFSVWKFSPKGKKRLMEWDSPWGNGFPGWHLECSAMALKYLGPTFDIHCGGIDHVRIHHTNEIAQTEAATGQKWVNWWMHGEFLLMDEGKMSKSADKFLTLSLLEEKGYHPLAYRLYLMSAHYRKAMVFNYESMDGFQKAYERLCRRYGELPEEGGKISERHIHAFDESLDDDLNLPQAVAGMWGVLQDSSLSDEDKGATFREMDTVLGLQPQGDGRVSVKTDENDLSDDEILKRIEERTQAKKEKNFSMADQIRAELLEQGIELQDGPQGTTFQRK